MVLLRISAFLVVYAVFTCQISGSNAVPVRAMLESSTDRVALNDYEVRRLLNALVKEFMQMMAEELDQQVPDANSLDRPIVKRCTSLSTCVVGKLSQELHKLQTVQRTDVGAATPGKKRNILTGLENERYATHGEPFESA
ncbi:calcitonin/calcitonin-related polypeptide, alpha [Pristis pectinata]|uniref:calcitonin/calcitonin-related polypeptide, alpha n=1 Tax=Pristis pectinata TaxID=685728 RepID=UPI00223CC3BD|nr:calcitonin/calcitonin-related polypeptide, alpha [Pristis pectinata]XP_051885362.1 calcitonin/calcitonin-related polypeptide, alpha [Pristis pectinata]XP_051885363.1 calcitonin/calcitonin-related polypeptide, alpha [Pristis pectinata]